ncbi:MAG: hypothetical protein ACKOCB_09560 [Planctomycetia bacterium]
MNKIRPRALVACMMAGVVLMGWASTQLAFASANGGTCVTTGHRDALGNPLAPTCSTGQNACPAGYTCKLQAAPGIPPKVLPNGKTAYAWTCCCWKQNADGSVSVIWDLVGSVAKCDAVGWFYDSGSVLTVGDTGCAGPCPQQPQECVEQPPATSFRCQCQ